MRFGRFILAVMVAFALGTAPVSAYVSAASASAAGAMTGCCESHGMPCDDTGKPMGACNAMPACFLKCCNFVTSAVAGVAPAPLMAALAPLRANHRLRSEPEHPPFRPPRI